MGRQHLHGRDIVTSSIGDCFRPHKQCLQYGDIHTHTKSRIVQAMDEYKEEINIQNLKLAVDIAINNGYRLSYQIHKDLGIE